MFLLGKYSLPFNYYLLDNFLCSHSVLWIEMFLYLNSIFAFYPLKDSRFPGSSSGHWIFLNWLFERRPINLPCRPIVRMTVMSQRGLRSFAIPRPSKGLWDGRLEPGQTTTCWLTNSVALTIQTWRGWCTNLLTTKPNQTVFPFLLSLLHPLPGLTRTGSGPARDWPVAGCGHPTLDITAMLQHHRRSYIWLLYCPAL